jgi:hypothetical protein
MSISNKLLQNTTQILGWKFGTRKVARLFVISMPEREDTKCVILACDRVCVSVLSESGHRLCPWFASYPFNTYSRDENYPSIFHKDPSPDSI